MRGREYSEEDCGEAPKALLAEQGEWAELKVSVVE
jgi:hypothetical protein